MRRPFLAAAAALVGLVASASLSLAAPAPCSPFGNFPLAINLGTGLNTGDGETVRCSLGKVMNAVNTLNSTPVFTGTVSAPSLSLTNSIAAIQPAASPVASKFPGTFIFAANNNNSLVGSVYSNRPYGVATFDTAVTGYGQLAAGSNGNTVFGLFGRADMYAPGIGTNEVNSFNYTGQDAPTAFPWNRSFGTTQSIAVALTVAAGGNNKSAAGIEIAQEGERPNYFQYGLVMRKEVNALYNIYLDADAYSSPLNGIYSATKGAGINLTLVTTTPATPKTRVLSAINYGGGEVAAITNDGTGYFSLLNLRQSTPASSAAPCTAGDITADSTAIYVCVAPSNWRRVLYSTF